MEKGSDQAGFSPRRGREAFYRALVWSEGEGRVLETIQTGRISSEKLVRIQQTEYQVKKCRFQNNDCQISVSANPYS
jgi:hypothetical protein